MSRASPRTGNGFTFLEVLVALLICSLIVFAVSVSLITVLTAERTTAVIRDAGLALQTLATRYYLQEEPVEEMVRSIGPAWAGHVDGIRTGEKEDAVDWDRLTLTPRSDPDLESVVAMRATLSAWE